MLLWHRIKQLSIISPSVSRPATRSNSVPIDWQTTGLPSARLAGPLLISWVSEIWPLMTKMCMVNQITMMSYCHYCDQGQQSWKGGTLLVGKTGHRVSIFVLEVPCGTVNFSTPSTALHWDSTIVRYNSTTFLRLLHL